VVVGVPGPLDFPEAGIRGRQQTLQTCADFSAAKVGTMIQSRWNEGLLDGTLPSTDGHHFMASTAGIGLAFQ